MSTWFSKEIDDGVMIVNPTGKIRELFLPMWELAGKPDEMAVYISSEYKRDPDNGCLKAMHTAYFTPSAAEMAKLFGALPCEKPKTENLQRLIGLRAANTF